MSAQDKINNNQVEERNNAPKGARLIFGLFMIVIYVGVGILCILDIFNFDNAAISMGLGILLIIYGIWRAIRLFKGWN